MSTYILLALPLTDSVRAARLLCKNCTRAALGKEIKKSARALFIKVTSFIVWQAAEQINFLVFSFALFHCPLSKWQAHFSSITKHLNRNKNKNLRPDKCSTADYKILTGRRFCSFDWRRLRASQWIDESAKEQQQQQMALGKAGEEEGTSRMCRETRESRGALAGDQIVPDCLLKGLIDDAWPLAGRSMKNGSVCQNWHIDGWIKSTRLLHFTLCGLFTGSKNMKDQEMPSLLSKSFIHFLTRALSIQLFCRLITPIIISTAVKKARAGLRRRRVRRYIAVHTFPDFCLSATCAT